MNATTGSQTMRVLFVVFSRSSLGHIVRSTTAAARFAASGHDVLVACHEEAREIPEKAGLAWRAIREIGPAPAWRGMDDIEVLRAFVRTRLASPAYVSECLEDELRIVEEFRPDVVISDMRNTAGVAAAIRGVPAYSIHNLRLFQHPMHVVLPEVLVTLADLGIAPQHARQALGRAVLVPDVSILDSLTSIPPATAGLVCSLADEVRHVGPMMPPELLDLAPATAEASAHRDGRPLVHISLGGSGAGDHEVARIVSAIGDLPIDIAVTLGASIATDDIAAQQRELDALVDEAAVTVTGFRHDALAVTRSADAAVLHGGHSSMIEGLACATPLVFVPHSSEQRHNAGRVRELGLGEVIGADDESSMIRAKIEAAIGRAHDPALRAFATTLIAADGAGSLVEYVQRSWQAQRGLVRS